MREMPVFHVSVQETFGRRLPRLRGGLDDEFGARLVAFGCAAFLLLAVIAPREFARTTWWTRGTAINDDPTGYVGLLSLCALVALIALAAEVWSRRWAIVAALVAAAAFASGTWVAVTYWLGFLQGERLREGQEMLGRKAQVHFPLLLPVFTVVAVVGFAFAVVLVFHGWRRVRHGA